MTTVDAIYARHQRSLMAVDRADDVVLFSLRLALEELSSQSIPSTPSTDQRQAERTAAQLARLNDWLAMYEPSEYAAPGDTADAVLCVLNRMRTENAEMRAALQQLEEMRRHSDATPSAISKTNYTRS